MRKRFAFALSALAAVGPLAMVAPAADTAKIVLVAGRPSHGPGDHEFNAGCKLLAKCVGEMPGIEPVFVAGGWPTDERVFDGARTLVFFMDGGGGHPIIQKDHLETIQKFGQNLTNSLDSVKHGMKTDANTKEDVFASLKTELQNAMKKD